MHTSPVLVGEFIQCTSVYSVQYMLLNSLRHLSNYFLFSGIAIIILLDTDL